MIKVADEFTPGIKFDIKTLESSRSAFASMSASWPRRSQDSPDREAIEIRRMAISDFRGSLFF
jgi:hypothetical protein